MIVGTYLFPILISIVFGYYNGWQWIDEQDGVYDPKKSKKRWKFASVILRIIVLVGVWFFSKYPANTKDLIFAASISLPVFDMAINITAGKSLFYLGTTSKTDLLGRYKWYGYLAVIIAALIYRVV